MAYNIPTFKRIEQLKNQARVGANISRMVCDRFLQEQASKVGNIAPRAADPFKYYARMLGLRNGDVNGSPR